MIRRMTGFKSMVAGLLLLLVSVFHLSTSMSYHTHTIDGRLISHSHISALDHSSQGDNDGGHTQLELDLIMALGSTVLETTTIVDSLQEVMLPLEVVISPSAIVAHIYAAVGIESLRAPPTKA